MREIKFRAWCINLKKMIFDTSETGSIKSRTRTAKSMWEEGRE